MVGRAVSIDELFVTDLAVNESASFPIVSCTAGFVFAELGVGAVYATVIVLSFGTAVASVKTTVALVPGAVTVEMVTGLPFTVTTKSVAVAVVDFSVSLYVNVNVVPFEPKTAVLSTGPVWSTLELLVTDVAANDAASLPAVSCTAAFVVPLSTVGAAYATVTALPFPIGDESVNTTEVVEPLAVTDDTVTGEPFTKTVKALAGGLGSRRVSL